MKFIRAYPDKEAPKHRYISYIHYLSSKPCTFEEFSKAIKLGSYRNLTPDLLVEHAYAFIWLIENGYIKVVDDEHGVH